MYKCSNSFLKYMIFIFGSLFLSNVTHSQVLAKSKDYTAEWCTNDECEKKLPFSIKIEIHNDKCFSKSQGQLKYLLKKVDKEIKTSFPEVKTHRSKNKIYGYDEYNNLKYEGIWQYVQEQIWFEGVSYDELECNEKVTDNLGERKTISRLISTREDLDYLALSEEKLGVKFGVFNGLFLYIKEVSLGGKAEKSKLTKNMAVLRVGPKRYPTQSLKHYTESMFVDGVAGSLDLQVMDLTKYMDVGPFDMKRFEEDWKEYGGKSITINFEGSNREDYRRAKISSKLATAKEPFFYLEILIIPHVKNSGKSSYYSMVEKIYSDSDVCPLPCSIELYSSSGSILEKFTAELAPGASQPVETPISSVDWVLVNKNQPEAPKEVIDAFTRRKGLIGSATLDPSYFLAINEKERIFSNYKRFNSLNEWKNMFVAFAIGYAETCGHPSNGRLIEVTIDLYRDNLKVTSSTYLVEEELYSLVKEFGVDRNNVLGVGLNGAIALAIKDLGCNSEYIANYRRVALAFFDQYTSGRLDVVDLPGLYGFNHKAIGRKSYNSLFGY